MIGNIAINKFVFDSEKVTEEMKFVFVSDLHNYPNRPVCDAIASINPTAVLVGGDFIQSKTDMLSGMEFLKTVSAEFPVFCSSGKEHDFNKTLIEIIEKTGAVFLRNQSIEFHGIRIGGLNTIRLRGQPENEQEERIGINRKWLAEFEKHSEYKLLLCHHPEYYDLFVNEYRIDLVLSGHAHGGQWRLFNRGLYAPGQGLFPKYTSGLYDERLLVGRGIGNSYRIPRINNKPEMLEIVLKGKDLYRNDDK